jgi:transposase
MPVNSAARILGVDDNKLWRMIQFYVEKALAETDLSMVSKIGADETSKRKGHDYITLIMDLIEKCTIFVAEGKSSDTIENFKKELIAHGGAPENITDASIDMSPAFIKGLRENFPNAEITFDKFHISKIINEAVDKIRKRELGEQNVLRGMKYVFLKNRENLTESQHRKLKILESVPNLNLKTTKALHIREAFQEIYKENDQVGFERMLKRWYFWATHSRLEPIIEAAKTIKSHWNGVLKWFESRVSNGILEGINSLIQAAKAKARGYRTFRNFRAIVFMLTGKLDFGLPT